MKQKQNNGKRVAKNLVENCVMPISSGRGGLGGGGVERPIYNAAPVVLPVKNVIVHVVFSDA